MRHPCTVTFAAFFSLCLAPLACGQPEAGPGAAAETLTAAPASPSPAAAAATEAPLQERPLLAPDEQRVPLFVLPGDAVVEVDGQRVRRRNGVIDLIGKVGAVRRVRVTLGEKSSEERAVTIQEASASPPLIDLDEPPPPGAGKPKAKAKPKAIDIDD